uniref:Uncharacterized protein n=1 Tax=Riboviria sp. TaxID=2585031 RepID=A0A8K1WSF6_9VIRU|nr:MAG: hypothetical protein 2 [Riboviria sp.]
MLKMRVTPFSLFSRERRSSFKLSSTTTWPLSPDIHFATLSRNSSDIHFFSRSNKSRLDLPWSFHGYPTEELASIDSFTPSASPKTASSSDRTRRLELAGRGYQRATCSKAASISSSGIRTTFADHLLKETQLGSFHSPFNSNFLSRAGFLVRGSIPFQRELLKSVLDGV